MRTMQRGDEETGGDEVANITIGQLLAEEIARELRGDLHELEFNYTNCCDSNVSKYWDDPILEMGLR